MQLSKTFTLIFLCIFIISCGGGGGSSTKPVTNPGTGNSNSSPTSSAGQDQTVDEGTQVTLSGSGTDSDGSISSYSWTQTAGTTVTLSGASSASTTFTAPEVESDEELTFQLTVTDNDGASNTNTVSIVVTDIPSTKVLWSITESSFFNNGSRPDMGIDNNGNIIFSGTGAVNSISPSGVVNWSYSLDDTATNRGRGSAVIDSANNIYIRDIDKYISLSPTGQKRWEIEIYNGYPALVNDTLMLVFYDYNDRKPYFRTYNSDGELLNEIDLSNILSTLNLSAGQLDPDTVIYTSDNSLLFTAGEKIIKLSTSGQVIWFLDDVSGQISVADNGNIYVSGYSSGVRKLYAVSSNGVGRWTKELLRPGIASIAPDGSIYIHHEDSSNRYLNAYTSDGTLKWQYNTGFSAGWGDVYKGPISPTIDDSGNIIIRKRIKYDDNSIDYFIVSLNSSGDENWSVETIFETVVGAPTISDDGVIYIHQSSTITAIQGDDKLATTGWPRTGRNNQNTNTASPNNSGGNNYPIVNAGADQTVDSDNQVTLTGTASDSDGFIANITWEQVQGESVTLTNVNSLTTSFDIPNNASSGEVFEFRLTVVDDQGNSASDTVLVTVENTGPIDSDNDGVIDDLDNCVGVYNPWQKEDSYNVFNACNDHDDIIYEWSNFKNYFYDQAINEETILFDNISINDIYASLGSSIISGDELPEPSIDYDVFNLEPGTYKITLQSSYPDADISLTFSSDIQVHSLSQSSNDITAIVSSVTYNPDSRLIINDGNGARYEYRLQVKNLDSPNGTSTNSILKSPATWIDYKMVEYVNSSDDIDLIKIEDMPIGELNINTISDDQMSVRLYDGDLNLVTLTLDSNKEARYADIPDSGRTYYIQISNKNYTGFKYSVYLNFGG